MNKLDKYIDNSLNWNDIDNKWDNYYNVADILKNEDVVSLDSGYIVRVKEGYCTDFFVLEHCCTAEDGVAYATMLYYLEGYEGLRELRHTWFKPYINYINFSLIEESLKELRRYFDV